MRGCRQSFAFARVLPLPADRTFFFAVHDESILPALFLLLQSLFSTTSDSRQPAPSIFSRLRTRRS